MKSPIKACVNSGFCCLKVPCGFGKKAADHIGCAYVIFDNDNRSSCSIAEEIVKCPTSKFSPAFGAGCCASLFNERRTDIIIKFHDSKEQYTGEYIEY